MKIVCNYSARTTTKYLYMLIKLQASSRLSRIRLQPTSQDYNKLNVYIYSSYNCQTGLLKKASIILSIGTMTWWMLPRQGWVTNSWQDINYTTKQKYTMTWWMLPWQGWITNSWWDINYTTEQKYTNSEDNFIVKLSKCINSLYMFVWTMAEQIINEGLPLWR